MIACSDLAFGLLFVAWVIAMGGLWSIRRVVR